MKTNRCRHNRRLSGECLESRRVLADALQALEVGPTEGSHPGNFIELGDLILFDATVNDSHEVWVTDGSRDGTRSLRGTEVSPLGIQQPLGVAESRAVFLDFRNEMWASDGTIAGTLPLGLQCNRSRPGVT